MGAALALGAVGGGAADEEAVGVVPFAVPVTEPTCGADDTDAARLAEALALGTGAPALAEADAVASAELEAEASAGSAMTAGAAGG